MARDRGVGGKLGKGRKGRELKILWWITITASFLLGRAGCLALHRDGISRHEVSSPPYTSTSAPRAAPDRDFDRSRYLRVPRIANLRSIFQGRLSNFRKSRIERLNSLPEFEATIDRVYN